MKRFLYISTSLQALAAASTLTIAGCSNSSFSGSSKTKKAATRFSPGEGIPQVERAVFAVRDIGCAMCHAKVDSSIISDFNYDRSDITQHQALASILHTLTEPARRPEVQGDFVIPKVEIKHATGAKAVPAPGTCDVGLNHNSTLPDTATSIPLGETLRRCLEGYFSWGASSKKFREVASIEILPPSDPDDIRAMAVRDGVLLAAGTLAALPSFDPAQPREKRKPGTQSGFDASGGALKISGQVTCDGAHIFDGPVVIDNATVKTSQGCRIYATGSIFVRNKLEIINVAAADAADIAAIQLMSATYVGFHMETSIIAARLNHGTVKNRSFRGGTGADYATRVTKDLATAGYAELSAAEKSAGENVSYSRIAVSAPIVHGRNKGEFSGAVVAEHYIGRIAALSFKFDPVFDRAPFFPELGRKIVTVTE